MSQMDNPLFSSLTFSSSSSHEKKHPLYIPPVKTQDPIGQT